MAKPASETIDPAPGFAELVSAGSSLAAAKWAAFIFSAFVNLLMLTAPLYMLQVYDRVLASRSEETLVVLSLLVALLFLLMGLLDHARSRIMARVGARLQATLDARVMEASFRRLAFAPRDLAALAAQRDLDAIARFWASPAILALFDLLWTPFFFAALFIFHPLLGWAAVAGGLLLVLFSWVNQRSSEAPMNDTTLATFASDRQGDALKSEAELIRALGMSGAALTRGESGRTHARLNGLAVADAARRWTVLTRTFRLFLQSAMLGLAAWLVLRDDLTAGAMVATSVLMGRALKPIEQMVAQWSGFGRARQAKARLAELLSRTPQQVPRTPLPRPSARLEVVGLSMLLPGGTAPVLRGISFTLSPGQAIGVIGPSGAGKSTLARALTGVWRPSAGQIRLDGATLDQYGPDDLGRWIGYLPQRIALFDGTVAENISHLQCGTHPDRIIAAARAAAAHELILGLPDGYDTLLSATGCNLSGGQIQRLGLARALFGDPVLLILDEPNASLDSDGAEALNHAIRAAKHAGAAVLVMAHRPAALQQCEHLLVLKADTMIAFGPRDTVLRETVRNSGDIALNIGRIAGS